MLMSFSGNAIYLSDLLLAFKVVNISRIVEASVKRQLRLGEKFFITYPPP